MFSLFSLYDTSTKSTFPPSVVKLLVLICKTLLSYESIGPASVPPTSDSILSDIENDDVRNRILSEIEKGKGKNQN